MDFLKSISIAASGLARAGRAHARHLGKHRQCRFHRAEGRAAIPIAARCRPSRSELDRSLDAHVVGLGRVPPDNHEFRVKHEPGHPAADDSGNVKYPNVNSLVEATDMREAQRSYEANLNVIGATRRMIQRTLDILKA